MGPLITLKIHPDGYNLKLLGIIDFGIVFVDKERENEVTMLCFDVELFNRLGFGINFSTR
jgi:hypothetical protein